MENVQRVHPGVKILDVSSRSGAGMDAWIEMLETAIRSKLANAIHEPALSLSALAQVIGRGTGEVRRDIVRIYALLIAFNVAIWAIAMFAFAKYPLLLGTALLAYTFGLRHAVDADHISAIETLPGS